jgi:hypothetical protein
MGLLTTTQQYKNQLLSFYYLPGTARPGYFSSSNVVAFLINDPSSTLLAANTRTGTNTSSLSTLAASMYIAGPLEISGAGSNGYTRKTLAVTFAEQSGVTGNSALLVLQLPSFAQASWTSAGTIGPFNAICYATTNSTTISDTSGTLIGFEYFSSITLASGATYQHTVQTIATA